ncbi:MAG: hypothetical protein VW771_05430 [Gammaproteobacteria bacterium]
MISLGVTALLIALAVASETILEIGSELTAATIDDTDMGALIEPLAAPQTTLVDLAPNASVEWSRMEQQ